MVRKAPVNELEPDAATAVMLPRATAMVLKAPAIELEPLAATAVKLP